MDLLERYLQAVGEHLPAKGKADTLAELRANLLAEMEGREEELGRPLTESEISAVLEQHGRPVLVAARYLPQNFLIGPGLFPLYWFTLKKSFPLVVLAYCVVQALTLATHGWEGLSLGAVIGHFPSVALTFWGVVTLGFAIFEYAQGRFIDPVKWSKEWNPRELPAMTQDKGPSLANRVADLIVQMLLVAWLLAEPHHPYLLLGPGGSLQAMHFGLSPEWRIFYWQIVGLLALMIPLKAAALFNGTTRLRKVLALATHGLGTLVLVVMVQARSYFVPLYSGKQIPNLATLAAVNSSLNLAFKIALAISVVKLLWDLWQLMKEPRQRQTGYAAVW